MDTKQIMETFRAVLLQTEERRRQVAEEAKRRQNAEEAEKRQKALMLGTDERQKYCCLSRRNNKKKNRNHENTKTEAQAIRRA